MNTKDFLRLGVPLGEATRRATDFVAKFILGGGDKSRLHEEVAAIVANPSAFVDDPLRGEFAKALLKRAASAARRACQIPAVGRRAGTRGGDANGEGLFAAGFRGGRLDAGCARRLRPAHRRRAGDGKRRDSLRRRRGHCLPHENDGVGYSVARFGAEAGPPDPRHRGGNALWRWRDVQGSPLPTR